MSTRPTNKSSNKTSAFLAWEAEAREESSLRYIYGYNAEQLLDLWRRLPEGLRHDGAVRSTIALCFLRLGDRTSARSVDPFPLLNHRRLSDRLALRLSRWVVSLYLWELNFILKPIAFLVGLFYRKYSDSDLFLNMYYQVFADNTAGFKCLLPCFLRVVLRPESPDRQRIAGLFGYLCALNSLIDLGNALMKKEIAKFTTLPDQHPKIFWLQELKVLQGIAHYYKAEYGPAEAIFREIAATPNDPAHSFLFVKTINLASGLRIALLKQDVESFEEVAAGLLKIFSGDYDVRYALRAHSYRSLVAAKRGDTERCLRELAIANSIADQRQNEICNTEICSHFGAKTRVYLYLGDWKHAFEASQKYLDHYINFSSLSWLVWDANLLALKTILIEKVLVPPMSRSAHNFDAMVRRIARNLHPFKDLYQNGKNLYTSLYRLVQSVDCLNPHQIIATVKDIASRHPEDMAEVLAVFRKLDHDIPGSDTFASSAQKTTDLLRIHDELLNFMNVMQSTDLTMLTTSFILECSKPVFQILFPQCQIFALDDQQRVREGRGIPQGHGITEYSTQAGFEAELNFKEAGNSSPLRFILSNYGESFNFRKDVLAALILWKEIGESVLRDKVMRQKEVEFEKSRAIEQTTQMLAHDVRKPFSFLRMGLGLLASAKDEQKIQEILKMLLPEVDRAMSSVNGLIQDILEVGSTNASLNLEPVSLSKVIDNSLSEVFRVYPKASITFEFDLAHSHKVLINPLKVGRVFSNIMANAVQAVKMKGHMWFRTVNRGEFVEIVIGNEGSSIAAEELPKLFDAFYTKGKKKGTGLGLAIAKKIVTAHGGRIWCVSAQNDRWPLGMVAFHFTLPKALEVERSENPRLSLHSRDYVLSALRWLEPDNTGMNEVADRDLENALNRRREELGRPLRTLLVDDEEIYRKALKEFLSRSIDTRESVDVRDVGSPEEALALLESGSFDIVVTDIDLKHEELDGFDLIRQVRAGPNPSTFICVHSNRIVPSDYSDAMKAGADAFLPKPMARGQMMRLLILGASRVRDHVSTGSLDFHRAEKS